MTKMRMFLLGCFVIITSALFAQKQTIIQGVLNSETKEKVFLHIIKEGEIYEYASTSVTPNGEFGFIVKPTKEQPYIISTKHNQQTIWVKPGEHIQMELKSPHIRFTGKVSEENKSLEKWANTIGKVKEKASSFTRVISTFEDFFPDLDTLQQASKAYLTDFKSKNAEFTAFAQNMVKYDLFYYPVRFMLAPRVKHPTREQYHSLYNIKPEELFQDNSILTMPYGLAAIRLYPTFILLKDGKKIETKEVLATIPCKQIQGEHLINDAGGLKYFEQYKQLIATFKDCFVTPSQQKRIEAIGSKLYSNELKSNQGKAQKAANFTYPDRNGKMVSLSDFKGKVVVIDVWATWCGPCLQQIPYLIKIEEEFKGKDVVFVGVSVDEEKDHAKWIKMLDDKGLHGVQLFAKGWSKITKDYDITAIPRFMVIGKDGNVISAKAPRPADPALKIMIEKALQ